MSTTKRYLIILAVTIIATAAAIAFYNYYTPKRQAFVDTAEVRVIVSGLGDELRSVSLLAPAADVAAAMDRHYAYYVHPDLLATWKANPRTALGRLTSSPWPDRIEITETVKNDDDTYTVTGNVIEVAEGPQGSQTVTTTPYRFTLALGGDGWQIVDVRKQ